MVKDLTLGTSTHASMMAAVTNDTGIVPGNNNMAEIVLDRNTNGMTSSMGLGMEGGHARGKAAGGRTARLGATHVVMLPNHNTDTTTMVLIATVARNHDKPEPRRGNRRSEHRQYRQGPNAPWQRGHACNPSSRCNG